jgi:hypothetical protein
VNKFYIDSRQAGKTTKIVKAFCEKLLFPNGSNSIVFCQNNQIRKHFIDIVLREIHPHTANKKLIEKCVLVPAQELLFRLDRKGEDTTVYVDEYLFFRDRDKKLLYQLFHGPLSDCEWVIRTTSNKMYRKDILGLVNKIKTDAGHQARSLCYTVGNFLSDEDKRDFDELEGLLLSEPSFTIEAGRAPTEREMSREEFELQMLGRFLH